MFGLLDYLKIGLGVAAGIVIGSVYYNGVPVLKDLPVVGFLFDGQAKKGLVPEFQAAALRAEIDELRRQGRANALVIEAYQVQLRNARAAEAAQIEKSEQEIADYEKKLAAAGRACLLDRDDLQFLRQ
ncbi:hypothetical protein GJU94_08220 [Brucella sp. 10RB9214]|uniref:hypothetical protein n=1 Tax=unclassified Brucella TaxID=2632610 RepID=UPI000972E0D7|nr:MULTISPECIES: hypothetical protein [unclassified Brucella]APY13148.1 hypothetical protein BKD02_01495 [Brucella sp. 09RB8910]MRN46110.1 hypothetical protein [Brucella sp. 10RB9212]MRN49815.1 hypothetical protein [Brucella sp. 10RB9214]UWF67383.1 hypothetical protein NYO63_04375 [Brucella sp. 1315]UWF70508.1 hypothetical protein NYO65_04375 [Brucella sp. 2594]